MVVVGIRAESADVGHFSAVFRGVPCVEAWQRLTVKRLSLESNQRALGLPKRKSSAFFFVSSLLRYIVRSQVTFNYWLN